MATTQLRFPAMGTDAHLVVVGGSTRLAGRLERRIDELEARWSRFRPDSEVSRLTERAGAPVEVSPETALLVRRGIDAWHQSGGACDPLVLPAVVAAGYDRSFELLSPPRPAPAVPATGGGRARPVASPMLATCADIEVDGSSVRLPAGTGFDPGGIGKGLAADLVAEQAIAEGAAGVCVNLGGDLRVIGPSPDGGAWTVSVDHPRRATPLVHLGVAGGGVATSTTLRRRWTTGATVHHHLIDPATSLPSDSDLELATAVAGAAWMAEAMAKAVLLRRAAHAFDVVDGNGAEALAVATDGRVLSSAGFGRFALTTNDEAA